MVVRHGLHLPPTKELSQRQASCSVAGHGGEAAAVSGQAARGAALGGGGPRPGAGARPAGGAPGGTRSRWKAARFSLRVTSSSAAPAMKPYALSDSFCRASGSYSSRFTGSIALSPLSSAVAARAILYRGGVPEWFIGTVLKTVAPIYRGRGFESHPLRQALPVPP